MKYGAQDHTFVVCAYKESEFLDDCIESLLLQTVPSNVIVVTSTPNTHIKSTCARHDLELRVGTHESGISRDWNYALSCARTPLVTIAHQDDIYLPSYVEGMLSSLNDSKDPLIYFCNYSELRGSDEVRDNTLLRIKRLLLSPLRARLLHNSKLARRRILSLGSPICCPSVTYVTSNLNGFCFPEKFKCDLDWQSWEIISRMDGSFVYDDHIRMFHRVHAGSETTALIENNIRGVEDLEMFRLFWPEPIARGLARIYSTSQLSNKQ